MNNTYKLDTKIGNIISIKKVIVAVIGKKRHRLLNTRIFKSK